MPRLGLQKLRAKYATEGADGDFSMAPAGKELPKSQRERVKKAIVRGNEIAARKRRTK